MTCQSGVHKWDYNFGVLRLSRHELPWRTIFGHEWGDLAMIFTSDMIICPGYLQNRLYFGHALLNIHVYIDMY